MTDAEYEQTKNRIQAIADEWVRCLGLGWWHIYFVYHRDSSEYLESSSEPDMPLGSKGYTSASWAYCDATVHFNMPFLTEDDSSKLEEVVVHELTHILVHEMRSGTRCDCPYDIRHEERVCTTLQRAFASTKDHFLHTVHKDETLMPSEETTTDAG